MSQEPTPSITRPRPTLPDVFEWEKPYARIRTLDPQSSDIHGPPPVYEHPHRNQPPNSIQRAQRKPTLSFLPAVPSLSRTAVRTLDNVLVFQQPPRTWK